MHFGTYCQFELQYVLGGIPRPTRRIESAVTEGVIKAIAGKLLLSEFEALKSAISMMPARMADHFQTGYF